ncbi:MAG: hypothetical protein Kow00108_19750 [Calditrichia bacterium]
MRLKMAIFIYICCMVVFSYAQPLAGEYTVGGNNPDFNTLQEAVASLEANGISAAVTFNLRAGIYESNGGSERALHISQDISGISTTNTITFQSDAGNGANAWNTILRRTIANNQPGTSVFGWVALIKSSYIILRNLTFEYANADSTGSGVDNTRSIVHFQPSQGSSLNNITISGCRFISSGNFRPFRALGFDSQANDIIIENNHFERIGAAINMEFYNGGNGITIRNNTFRNLSTYQTVQNDYTGKAIYVSNSNNILISGNDIDYEVRSTGIMGIQVIGSNATIEGNRIRNVPNQGYPYDSYWGLFLRSTGGDWLVSNNMISNIRKHAEGIHLENSSNMKIYHNTVVLTFDYFSRQTGLVLQNVNDIDISNNILVVKANNYANTKIIQSFGTVSGITSDYNLLYSNRFHITYDNTEYDSLLAWQGTGRDLNSRSFEPEFVDFDPFSDVHIGDCSLGDSLLWGIPIVEVATDFDGEVRDSDHPYMGADEVDVVRPDVFTPVKTTSLNDAGGHFSSADVDNDGDLDIVVVNASSPNGSEDISLFLNDGQGNFGTPNHLAFGTQPAIVRAGDVDGDNVTDLFVAGTDQMMVRWGSGGGNFDDIQTISSTMTVTDFVLADLDDDGDLDIAKSHLGTVGVEEGMVTVVLNNGNRNLSNGIGATGSPHPASIIASDINGDGMLDLMTSDYVNGMVSIFPNNGLNNEGNWTGISSTGDVYEVGLGGGEIHNNFAVADMDMDGDNDILVGSWEPATDSLALLRNDGTGSFSVEYLKLDTRRASKTFTVLDYENDGDPDIVTATNLNDMVLYLNNGFGEFEIMRLCRTTNFGLTPVTMVHGDFNNDDLTDVAVLTINDFSTIFNLNYIVNIGNEGPEPDNKIPQRFSLSQNFPNPFNPTTTIRYDLPERTHVELSIHNILGRKIKTVINGMKPAGRHQIYVDMTGVSSGVYFYRLKTKNFIETKKMIFLK